jgi:hypothetical protein
MGKAGSSCFYPRYKRGSLPISRIRTRMRSGSRERCDRHDRPGGWGGWKGDFSIIRTHQNSTKMHPGIILSTSVLYFGLMIRRRARTCPSLPRWRGSGHQPPGLVDGSGEHPKQLSSAGFTWRDIVGSKRLCCVLGCCDLLDRTARQGSTPWCSYALHPCQGRWSGWRP